MTAECRWSRRASLLVVAGLSIVADGCRLAREPRDVHTQTAHANPLRTSTPTPSREEPVPVTVDPLAKEIEWARARWQDPLMGVELGSLAAQLVEWVSPGRELEAYVLAHDWDCKAILLSRVPAQDDDGSETPPKEWLVDRLVGRVIVSEQVLTDGGREQRWLAVGLGHEFHSSSGELQRWNASGELVSAVGNAIGDGGTVHGVLSHVSKDVARYAGQATTVSVGCDGPADIITCPSGEKQYCDRCERLRFRVSDYHPFAGSGWLGPPQACPARCPQRRHEAMPRLEQLFSTARTWRFLTPQEIAERGPPTVFRSRASCQRERERAR